MFSENQQIGNYTLIKRIGRGGFGEVWLAERRTALLTTRVAVKLPHDSQIDLETVRREAVLWEKASGHPNVLPIIEANIYDGQVVIVSEFAPDGALSELLGRGGGISPEKAVEIAIGITAGLDFLHSRRIIHRDIKPQNILLQGDTPRLADFGISHALQTSVASRSANIRGTFSYMAPETFDGKRNEQTDIWAVGVVLYQMLAGVLPFPQTETTALFGAIIMREPEPLADEIPARLKEIVAKALAKLPENRFQTAREIREELQKVLVALTHPTFAPTEVFKNNAQLIHDADTIEDRSVVTKLAGDRVRPTEKALPPDNPSVATYFIPPTVKLDEGQPAVSSSPEPLQPTAPAVYPEFQPIRPAVPQKLAAIEESTIRRNTRRTFYFLAPIIGLFVDWTLFNLLFEVFYTGGSGTLSFLQIRVLQIPIHIVIYGFLGALLGYLFPQERWRWGLWLGILNILWLAYVFVLQFDHLSILLAFLNLLDLALQLIAAGLASYLVSRLALPRNSALNE
jgi:serine/threonine protein kinase